METVTETESESETEMHWSHNLWLFMSVFIVINITLLYLSLAKGCGSNQVFNPRGDSSSLWDSLFIHWTQYMLKLKTATLQWEGVASSGPGIEDTLLWKCPCTGEVHSASEILFSRSTRKTSRVTAPGFLRNSWYFLMVLNNLVATLVALFTQRCTHPFL